MKVTTNTTTSTTTTRPIQKPSDLVILPKKALPRRKQSKLTPRRTRSGPTTPLLKWNLIDSKQQQQQPTSTTTTTTTGRRRDNVEEDEEDNRGGMKPRRDKGSRLVSARKLGAALWRFQTQAAAAEAEDAGADRRRRRRGGGGGRNVSGGGDGDGDRVGFKVCFNYLFEFQDLGLVLGFSKVCFLLSLNEPQEHYNIRGFEPATYCRQHISPYH